MSELTLKYMRESSDNESSCGSSVKLCQRYFAEGSTIHGMRYVCMPKSFVLRRLVWWAAFSACFVGFCVNAAERFKLFLSDPINVNIEINYKEEMIFPAVTICNHNMFRITKAAEFGIYESIQEILNLKTVPSSNLSSLTNASLSYYELLAHTKRDMIFNCQFDGQRCTELDFDEARTDFGVCYTFHAHNDTVVKHSGSSYGLVVTINVEQYEYMDGPETTAGVKVLLHDKDEVPRVGDLGVNVPPGFQALVRVQPITVVNIPSPKSNCYTKDDHQELVLFGKYDYSEIGCRAECEATFLKKECHCEPIDVPSSSTDSRKCTPHDERFCMQAAKERFRSVLANESCAKCIPTCTTTSYIPSISYASISQTNAEKILVREQKKVDVIRERLLAAKENQSRLDAQHSHRDTRRILKLLDGKRLMIEQEFYPDEQILRNLSAHLEPDCLAGIVATAHERRRVATDAMDDMKAVVPEFTGYTTGLLLISYIQFLWDVSLRLQHVGAHEIPDLMTDVASKNLSSEAFMLASRSLRQQLTEMRNIVNELQADLVSCIKALAQKLTEHSYLLANRDLDSFFKRQKNFTEHQVFCLEELDSTMTDSFKRIVETLENFSKNMQDANATRVLTENELARVQVVRTGCQEGFVGHSYFDRASVERFMTDIFTKAENEMFWSFERLERLLQMEPTQNFGITAAFKTLSIIEEELTNYQRRRITRYELALNLTSDDFAKELAFLTTYLSSLRQFIETKENTMNEFITGLQNIDHHIPKMLLVFLASSVLHDKSYEHVAGNTTAKLAHCKAAIQAISEKRIAAQSTLEQDMSRTMHELVDQLRSFNEETRLDNDFVMRNFLQLSIFYRELREESITQQRAYSIWGLLCDVGGGLGLFVGASFISCFELIDTFLMGFTRLFQRRNSPEDGERVQQLQYFTADYLKALAESNTVKFPVRSRISQNTFGSALQQ